jgi:hypothetical protein
MLTSSSFTPFRHSCLVIHAWHLVFLVPVTGKLVTGKLPTSKLVPGTRLVLGLGHSVLVRGDEPSVHEEK